MICRKKSFTFTHTLITFMNCKWKWWMIRVCKLICRQSTSSINCFNTDILKRIKCPHCVQNSHKKICLLMLKGHAFMLWIFSHLTWIGCSRWMRILLIMFRHSHTTPICDSCTHACISICHKVCGLILFRLTVCLCKQSHLTRREKKVWICLIICNEQLKLFKSNIWNSCDWSFRNWWMDVE